MKYGFLGCGNMGGAIARALRTATGEILITDRSGKARKLAEELDIRYGTAQEVASYCDRIFVAVKPHMVPEVLEPLQESLQERKPLIISMAAGLTTQRCCNALVTPEQESSFLEDMRFSGRLDKLEERLIDAASALSGCGPAYMYMFLEALADGAVACGIPRAKAMEYAAATMIGAASMVLTTGQHPGALKDAVCSPGGSTIAGVRALEQHGFRGAVMDCVAAAYEKNQKLGK